jgi:hypothetical protein
MLRRIQSALKQSIYARSKVTHVKIASDSRHFWISASLMRFPHMRTRMHQYWLLVKAITNDVQNAVAIWSTTTDWPVLVTEQSTALPERKLLQTATERAHLTPIRREFTMSPKHQAPASPPARGRFAFPLRPTHQTRPVEPLEVAGRHKNTGQKDHKGARSVKP